MKTALFAAALTSLASMATADFFSLIAARSGSPIHLQEIAANGLKLWIGKDTATFCPQPPVTKCPPGKFTNFALAEDGGSLAMGAEVPGGQLAYIHPLTGAVGYTEAHSASMPVGAKVAGWQFQEGTSFGTLQWRKRGFLACSVTADPNEGPWEVFIDIKTVTFGTNCLGFDALSSNQTKPQAWEYT